MSKYVNNTGYIHPDKRQAIEAAVTQLGYAPNRSARTLKTNTSTDILFVAPNMNERLYREIAESLSDVLGAQFRVILQLTHDDIGRESQILQECLNNPCAGLLLVTCQPQNSALFDQLQQRLPVIFLMRQPALQTPYTCMGFHHFDAVYALVSELIAQNFDRFALFTGNAAYSSEADCVRALQAALRNHGLPLADSHVVSVPFRKESMFRAVMRLFDTNDFPKAVICSSAQIAEAIRDVATFRNLTLGRDLFLFTLGEDSWYHSIFRNLTLATYRDVRKLGTLAAQALLAHMQSPMVYAHQQIRLQDDFNFARVGDFVHRVEQNLPAAAPVAAQSTLKLLFNQADAGTDALRSLLPQFTQTHGIAVEMTTLSHDDLYRVVRDQSQPFDLCAVDTSWVPYLSSRGVLADLTEQVQSSAIPAQLAPRTLARVGTQQGKIYGVPHTYSLQLLYYRKDFFEDADLAAAFFAQYQVPLAPPKSWHMFQIISQFFTQQSHAASPCPYGTTVYTGVCPSALCCDLYPRMTAHNGGIFDARGQVQLYRVENLKAYQSLLGCLPYAVSQQKEYLHLDNMQLLLSGEIAMCVAFSNNAGFLLDNSDIALRNQIGFAPIPAQQPVVSGWCTAIHAQSDQQAQAWDFVQWLSEMEIASAYTILGGASPMTSLLAQQSLVQMYPWNTLAQQEYHTGVARAMPVVRGVPVLDFAGVVEPILAEVVHQTLAGRMPLKMALLAAHQKLCDYAEDCGYPKNTAVDDGRWKERYV